MNSTQLGQPGIGDSPLRRGPPTVSPGTKLDAADAARQNPALAPPARRRTA